MLGGELSYYRDRNGLECDAIIHLDSGQWGAIEIKLGSDEDTINAAAKSLLKLGNLIDADKMPAPAFLMVLSGVCKYAYRRQDGVYVVPIGCLKP